MYNPPFSHIYVEREAFSYPTTKELLSTFAKRGSHIIEIAHYMDLFGRTHQSFMAQKTAPCLILAVKHGNFLYPGAPVCQDFGNPFFYYTSFAMNCPFDCEYCFLQGMYSSANIVLFVNQEDYFTEIRNVLAKHPVYLCISYDTDLLALEGLTGIVRHYLAFAAGEDMLTTEVRTKSAVSVESLASGLSPDTRSRTVMAYSLSPDPVISRFEHYTPGLTARLDALLAAQKAGFPIRLCFDPLIAIPDFESVYGAFLSQVREALRGIPVQDASIGGFRISDSYLKQMRKNRPASCLLQYPFKNEDHVCNYGERGRKMIDFVKEALFDFLPENKIFTI
ncbi:MAG: radical SAM protein [Lachnospiraceae bacterium]|nr:radical SAM protein [Lachnospiraceae bacterium]